MLTLTCINYIVLLKFFSIKSGLHFCIISVVCVSPCLSDLCFSLPMSVCVHHPCLYLCIRISNSVSLTVTYAMVFFQIRVLTKDTKARLL
jgi:hypothetical protein